MAMIAHGPTGSRVTFERLERCEGKLSRTVLRGGGGREVAPLPGVPQPSGDIVRPGQHSLVGGGSRGHGDHTVKKWLGHANISTTEIYANAVGEEETELAVRMWATR